MSSSLGTEEYGFASPAETKAEVEMLDHVITRDERQLKEGKEVRTDVSLQVLREIVSEVGGDDGGRGLAGTEAEVVAGCGNGHAHQVSVLRGRIEQV